MPVEQISPELVLVDAELGARARAALPEPAARALRPLRAAAPVEGPPSQPERRYPAWARITAALWLIVLGILIGGAAIPHAQDKPRIIPKNEDTSTKVCKPPPKQTTPSQPSPLPGRPLP